MNKIVFGLPGNELIAKTLANLLHAELGTIELRQFPDQETYLRVPQSVRGCQVILVCTLDNPDTKTLKLIFAAKTMKELGADCVGLVAPYLAYMRQDKRFKEGEAITSRIFASILSNCVDWIVTIDPHLHRFSSLAQIYSIPAVAGSATSLFSGYLRSLGQPIFLIGPDAESEQWVSALASEVKSRHIILNKLRRGDRDVSISFPDLTELRQCRPIIVDDIISSGHTMEEMVHYLIEDGFSQPICLAVHGIFAEDAAGRLKAAGATVITTNTIQNPMAALDVSALLASLIINL